MNEPAFSGVAKSLDEHWYEARQSLALADKRDEGLHLLFVKGDLGTEQTELWESQSTDGRNWSAPTRFSSNSLSDDFLQQLRRAEDGSLRAFWISNRRGLGWELWTSVRKAKADAWEPALRIPLENFKAGRTTSQIIPARLLHYGITQDRRGRWVLVNRSLSKKSILILVSDDGENWTEAGSIAARFTIVNPALVEDAGGRYRLLAFGTNGKLHLWSSNDLSSWDAKEFEINGYGHVGDVAMHPVHLLPHANGELTALISDAKIGLQYARFNPDTDEPNFDLVRGIGLEDYAATSFGNHYVIARRQNDAIELREYARFQTHPEGKKPDKGIIYSEYSPGVGGNSWRRIFARWRVIQPDVTAVGTGQDERVWWGIETGAMTLKDQDFFAVDVADGFFHHHVTMIAPCGETTGFASRDLKQPRIGIGRPSAGGYKFSQRDLPKTKGHVSALICDGKGRYVAGTSGGHIAVVDGADVTLVHDFPDDTITALARTDSAGAFIAGTARGRISLFDTEPRELDMEGVAAGAITAIAVDRNGTIWFGLAGGGVYTGKSGDWHQTMTNLKHAYDSVSQIVPDPDNGVWMIAGADQRSSGVLHSNGTTHQFFHPVDYDLFAPTGLAVSPAGRVWVGTAFDGLFEMAPQ